MTRRLRFTAMGTRVELIASGCDASSLDAARFGIERLERTWSRFLPASEVSRMNACAGVPAVVSEETFALVAAAIRGWRITGGLFDPLVLPDVIAHGYDRTFALVGAASGAPRRRPDVSLGTRPSLDDVVMNEGVPAVTLPYGAAFDPGGIGKGLAADIVAEVMPAAGACVNVGGDMRMLGEAPDGERWTVAVEDPFTRETVAVLGIGEGGVATTSITRRIWTVDGRAAHHVIDPRTHAPAATRVAAATVVAGEAWLAEVLAKALLLSGGAFSLLEEHGATGMVVDVDGRVRYAPSLEEHLVWAR